RVDKSAEEVERAPADGAPGARGVAAKPTETSVTITHPERVVYPALGITKGDVANYYRAVAPQLLAELAGRPTSLVRCPDGAAGNCFFQKHHAASLGPNVQAVEIREKDGGMAHYVTLDDADGLLELVQMNVL